MIVSPGSILSLSLLSLFVLIPEVSILQPDQRILIPLTHSLVIFACTTAPVLRPSGNLALPGRDPGPACRPPLVT